MSGTAFRWQNVRCEQFRNSRAASRNSQHTADRTHRLLLHRWRNREFPSLQIPMDSAHDAFPELKMVDCVVQFLIIVISAPYGTGIIRCKSTEPDILIVGCSTRLAGNRHIIKFRTRTCTAVHDVLHGAR